ncbi:MAG: biotin--[acetyl-CoA-carboxylase] ligase [Legionellales bacterium]|nr:biotin--[acetyl-CoA-carboxylase] ligase [Legionellales bacterium]OUX65195.1 MAG: biotin--[acetyl-CoA-carboxylase] ligase [Gammaproteobacteria bacterium TMED281]|tara:strand:- start:250 stop:1230 length:981 start_codon:yes stop_codon:yes gene_type:complete
MRNINNNISALFKLLNDVDFISQEFICSSLKLSKTDLNTLICKLREFNISILFKKKRGYRLLNKYELLNLEVVSKHLRHSEIDIDIFESLDSTNDYLKRDIKEGSFDLKVCLSEMQTKGRGRMNKKWHSPFGKNIYLSLGFSYDESINKLSGLSLITSLAVCKAVESICNLENQLHLKWPNDILFHSKKLCGLLTEVYTHNGMPFVIIGIGLNVNMVNLDLKGFINQPWCSLQSITSKFQDRNLICASIIDYLIDYLELYFRTDLNTFLDEWKKRDIFNGTEISVSSKGSKVVGLYRGINKSGCLMLEDSDKTIHALYSGDTTIIK